MKLIYKCREIQKATLLAAFYNTSHRSKFSLTCKILGVFCAHLYFFRMKFVPLQDYDLTRIFLPVSLLLVYNYCLPLYWE